MPSIDWPLEQLKQYKPQLNRESDFDDFWRTTITEATKQPLNAELIPYDLPARGLQCYAVRFDGYKGGRIAGWYLRPDGSRHACAINLGRRPTFYEHADHSLLEAHLLDFEGDLYGEKARVQFTHFLRSERKFDGIDALVIQLKHDIDHARAATLD